MPILRSYYQDVYRSPVVRLDGYSGRHGLTSSILAYLDFGGATGTSKDGLAVCRWWKPVPAALARRWR